MATAICAQAAEAEGTFCRAQGNLPAACQPASGRGDGDNQSHPTGVGELFPDWVLESMLLVGSRLGRSEDTASSDAVPARQRQGLEEVE